MKYHMRGKALLLLYRLERKAGRREMLTPQKAPTDMVLLSIFFFVMIKDTQSGQSEMLSPQKDSPHMELLSFYFSFAMITDTEILG